MKKLIVLGLTILMVLSGCFSTPAREVTNICDLLDEKVSWYKAVKKSEDKTQRDIAEAANVTEVTIRNRYKGLKDNIPTI